MELLPLEVVEKISEYLAPEDLARCCGVSRGWHEIFNQDWLWKAHSDPMLEEHLRTTPCLVEPAFVPPEEKDSTLAPINRWRQVFLKEKHIYNNWKHNYHKKESLFVLNGEVYREFLTNTLIVRWCLPVIEIWDVSVDPAVCVTKTDPSVAIIGWIGCDVSKGGLLVIQQIKFVKVLFVDVVSNYIQLKHVISLDDVAGQHSDSNYMQQLLLSSSPFHKQEINYLNCIKENSFIHVNASRSNLDIFDLETGEKVKEEFCPGIRRSEIFGIITSSTSNYVVVIVKLESEEYRIVNNYFYYIYNSKKSSFLPGPVVAKKTTVPEYGRIHRHYFAIREDDGFTIYDCRSREPLLKTLLDSEEFCFYRSGLNDYFLFKERKYRQGSSLHLHYSLTPISLIVYSLSSKTWKRISECKNVQVVKVFNNKLLAAFNPELGWYCLSGETWVKCDISFGSQTEINQASTKIISGHSLSRRYMDQHKSWKQLNIYHYW